MNHIGGTERELAPNDKISVAVENVGGIQEQRIAFTSGVNVLAGPNATNRTSLLRAIGGALGGTSGVLRRGADSATVTLSTANGEYTRRYQRSENAVRTLGNPYTDQEQLVDLFVCLLEDNPIRRAVRSDEDLTDLLLAPVDTDELEREISTLNSERDRIDEQLTEIDRERKRLPKLEEQRTGHRQELEEIESELNDLRTQTEATATQEHDSTAVESARTALQETRTSLEQTESELETQRSIRADLETELGNVREELAERDIDDTDLSGLETEIERLQGREAEMSAILNQLSTVLKQNREVLAGDDTVIAELTETDDPLDDLDPQSQSIECWTCGSQVRRQDISEQLEALDRLRQTKRSERKELRATLSEKRSTRDSIQQDIDRYERLTERKAELKREINQRTASIEELTTEAETLRDELAAKRATLNEAKAAEESAEVETYEKISELEYRRGQIKRDLEDTEDEINGIEYQLGKYDNLEKRREDITEQIHELRARVETIEQDIVETFNSHMDAVLGRLGYDNIERAWLERRTVGDETTFDLHIVRKDDSGAVYEDSIHHLSESEREVVGLMVALTGYLTHDVEQSVPFILLDSLEAIDAERIAELTRYVSAHTEFLLLALLEEDAAELPDSYQTLHAVEHLA